MIHLMKNHDKIKCFFFLKASKALKFWFLDFYNFKRNG